MRSILILSLVVVAFARTKFSRRHQKITGDFAGEKFVKYDENGAYVNCIHQTEITQPPTLVKCPLAAETMTGELGLACYAAWNENLVNRGCWIHQEVALQDQCTINGCSNNIEETIGTKFCCCRGHGCNDIA